MEEAYLITTFKNNQPFT